MANINLKGFPDDLHQAAKIKAAVEKTTLREIIIRALTEYVGLGEGEGVSKPRKGKARR
jgi:hypothetical protein